MKEHHFNTEDAVRYGIGEAIILYNIRFWIEKNKANNKHFHDGEYWTYNSTKAFSDLFPYFTENQIRRLLESLIKQGVIKIGNYNTSSYDRTRWFCVSSQVHLADLSNGLGEIHQPIPDNFKPNSKQETNSSFIFSPKEDILNKTSTDNAHAPASAGAREVEVDFFALDDDLTQDFTPSGIEPSKKPFIAPEHPKVYKYPPFQPNSPANIKNLYEEHVDSGRLDVFEYEYFNFIAWRQIKSDTGERPWDPDSVEVNDWVDFLNKTCKGSVPVRKYLGVEAQRTGTYVKKKYHYVYLFNYEYLSSPNVGPQLLKPMMDTATAYCETYYDLLRKLYQAKSKQKEVRKQIKINKYLGPDYEEIERPEGREDKE